MDILLDPISHDLVLRNFDLQMARGIDLVRQRLKQRLLFFHGEWFLAVNDGVPYFDEILVKAPDRGRVESLFKAAIVRTPGVAELLAFSVDYDPSLRKLHLAFQVRTVIGADGDVLDMEVEI